MSGRPSCLAAKPVAVRGIDQCTLEQIHLHTGPVIEAHSIAAVPDSSKPDWARARITA